jgi:hypothetical protein
MSKRPTPKEFIQAWQTSSSVKEVATKLRMTVKAASARAIFYRKKGVALKKMHRGRKGINWSELAEFARSFEKKGDQP